ncbi:hypothetical protein MnTg02_02550 [bacterium MnTg02]|nr:hypothetical protein MnTg02_02550 [bacterium MnTg02]
MKKSLLLIAGMLVPLFPTSSLAQTDTKAVQQCFYNGEKFNQNAHISIGGKLYKCIKGGLWNNNDGPNAKANCFYDGRIYSKGSKVSVADDQIIDCKDDGTWG